LSPFQPGICRTFNRGFVGLSTGDLSPFQPGFPASDFGDGFHGYRTKTPFNSKQYILGNTNRKVSSGNYA
jgi:hypothetical protein